MPEASIAWPIGMPMNIHTKKITSMMMAAMLMADP